MSYYPFFSIYRYLVDDCPSLRYLAINTNNNFAVHIVRTDLIQQLKRRGVVVRNLSYHLLNFHQLDDPEIDIFRENYNILRRIMREQ